MFSFIINRVIGEILKRRNFRWSVSYNVVYSATGYCQLDSISLNGHINYWNMMQAFAISYDSRNELLEIDGLQLATVACLAALKIVLWSVCVD